MIQMKFAYTDPGYCRAYYTTPGGRLYCVQEEAQGVYEFYSCTEDEEPLAPCKMDNVTFEPIPDPNEHDEAMMAFLREKGAMQ